MGLYHRILTWFIRTRAGVWMVLHVVNPIDKRLMRWSNGSLNMTVGTGYADSSMLLRCTGAQSGKTRDVPVFAFDHDGGWVLIASQGGLESNPAWYHNLKAHPRCALLVPHRGEVSCVAHEAEGEERERAWNAANTGYSGYAAYQQRTERPFPVMVLRPENNSS
ncbi:nitroreductase/quinone reductase family protein [Mycobacterium sp. 663a-19]|uniref:nitroreductase/quinone reductase family protein n=1 Tax=Mycobacterium sp. 663a-19 TaxID=2986148 RepID=UPI002D1EC4DF|nr:nitroreductase/quinone reductase family protein [Mycobacterium sp. 663a-19]MEB3983722.1 nitroreductase/quinone reductase family protein [Mycobacterium sp. 663a-19]